MEAFRRSTVSLCVLTDADPPQAAALLTAWRGLVDEIVVVVDHRAHPDTPAACRTQADQVYVVQSPGCVEQALGWLHSRARGDWILRMDDDELPSAALAAALPGLVASREHTHFWLRRRWLLGDPHRSIDSPPWGTDTHPRLLRNVAGLWRASGRLHREVEVLGPYRVVDAAFLHVTNLLDDLETRRRRAQDYAARGGDIHGDGFPVNEVYLAEEHSGLTFAEEPEVDAAMVRRFLEGARAPSPARAGRALHAEVDLATMEAWLDVRPGPSRSDTADVALCRRLPPLRAGAVVHVEVAITNTGASPWPAGRHGWPLLRVGHRWWTADGEALAEPTPRAAFTERVWPGATTSLHVPIQAPASPGVYELRLDVVEEHVRWFERPAVQTVEVTGPRVPPTEVATPTRTWRHRRRPVQRRDVMAADLRRLHDALAPTAFGQRYWVWGGMLLGWTRERRLLPHDLHDVDFAFEAVDSPLFAAAVPALIEAGFAPDVVFANNAGEATEWTFVRNGGKFEFWALQRRAGTWRYTAYANDSGGEGPPVQATAEIPAGPLTPFAFLDRRWQKVADHEGELSAVYGDWRTPDPGWWYLADRAIVSREPWQRSATAWDGTIAGVAP